MAGIVQRTGKRGRKSRRVRLEDLAARCGVSISTVSRALAGEKGVRSELRNLVLEAAKEANYAMPSSVAGSKVIIAASSAAMIDYMRNQFTVHVLDGVRQRAATLGIELVTRPIGSRADEQAALNEAMGDAGVAGVLFLTLDDEEMLALTRDFPKPVVLVNGDDPFMRLSSVTPCNRSAAHLATNHLIGLGHERIAFLTRPGRRTIERRKEGWRDALRQRGLPCSEDLVIEVDDWLPELAARAVKERIGRRGRNFTAVLAAGDSLAFGAMAGLQQLGIDVPREVSLVGMDNLPQAAFLTPALTTMHIPMREIGGAALDLLREDLTGLPIPPRRLELACHLIERRSTAIASTL
ncbi:MAG: LacI family DNA-binding transcriptional regulator [Devosia sp.]